MATEGFSNPILFRKAELLESGQCDVRIADGKIVAIAAQLQANCEDRVIEANGGLLIPGLLEHHMHLFATAAARQSLNCGPPAIVDEVGLKVALQTHDQSGSDWIRGTGFHDSVCPSLDRYWLDAICAERPVRIQHRSGMMWVLNSCAIDQLQLGEAERWPEGAERDESGKLTGRFYDLDEWLGAHLQRSWPELRQLSAELASYGITGVTDTGVNNDEAVWQAMRQAQAKGSLQQRLWVMGKPILSTMEEEAPSRLSVGPVKLYLREANLPDLDDFACDIKQAHQSGRAVAIHCVTRVELHIALEAIDQAEAMPGDRIEHASVADDYAIERMAALGVTAVTQPNFLAERGDQYLQDVEADDIPLLYRGKSFLDACVGLAAGSDAPYGSANPWAAMRAAVSRTTAKGVVMEAGERLAPELALGLFGGTPQSPGGGLRQLAVGQSADLCLLSVPWQQLQQDFDAKHVAMTLCGGRIIYEASNKSPKGVSE